MWRDVWLAILILVCGAPVSTFAQGIKLEPKPTVWLPAPTAVESRLRAALDQRTEIAFTDTPLMDVIDFLEDVHGIVVITDVRSLMAAKVTFDVPVNLELKEVSLRSALRLILAPNGLTYRIEDDVMKITSAETERSHFITRTYPIPDLVASDDDGSVAISQAMETAVGAASWGEKAGSVSYVHRSRSLVVRQTFTAHDEIVELLNSLRTAAAMQDQAAKLGKDSPDKLEPAVGQKPK